MDNHKTLIREVLNLRMRVNTIAINPIVPVNVSMLINYLLLYHNEYSDLLSQSACTKPKLQKDHFVRIHILIQTIIKSNFYKLFVIILLQLLFGTNLTIQTISSSLFD